MSAFKYQQQGMSLVEIIIILVILAILAVILTPKMDNYFSQANIKGAAEALHGDINLARTSAIKSTDSVTLTFVTGSSWCYGLSSGAINCTCNSAASATNCNLGITSSSNFQNTTLATTPTSITFAAGRGITNSSNTATFSTSSQSASVVINSMGIPSICSTGTTVGGYPAC